MSNLTRFINDESAVTAVEYAMIAAATTFVLAVVMPLIGGSLTTSYTSVGENLN